MQCQLAGDCTYLQSDEPTATVAAPDRLTCLAILPEVHVEVVLEKLLSTDIAGKADGTLLALGG